MKNGNIEVMSAGNKVGNYCRIKLNGKQTDRQNRGLSLFIYNKANQDIYHYHFDFYKYEVMTCPGTSNHP